MFRKARRNGSRSRLNFTRALDRIAPPGTVLASSTSGLPASAFTEGLEHRARCLVVHPINPPHLIPLVEIVPAPWTDAKVVERATALMREVGQSPIQLRREVNGFVVNRLQSAMLSEAFKLVEDGIVSVDEVDRAVSDGLGLRWSFMGPFQTIDLNAKTGVAEYCRNLGPMYYGLAKEQADPRPWTPEACRNGRRSVARTDAGARYCVLTAVARHIPCEAWRIQAPAELTAAPSSHPRGGE